MRKRREAKIPLSPIDQIQRLMADELQEVNILGGLAQQAPPKGITNILPL